MRHWLGAVLTPDGEVPLLNDGYPVDRELLAALRPGPDPVTPASPLLVLPETGLVRAVAGGWHLLADVGPPCPPSLPAHAHADTFGCLVHVDKVPLLVDTGTSTYEPGPVRRYERSTAAHSTVQVDGADSTEVWGVFRAGRRARVSGLAVHADAAGITCEAVHDGFRRPARPPPASPPLVADQRRASSRGHGDRARPARDRHPLAARGRVGGVGRRWYGACHRPGWRFLGDRRGYRPGAAGRRDQAGRCRVREHRRRARADLPDGCGAAGRRHHGTGVVPAAARAERERREASRAAGQRRARRGARRSLSRDQPDRGAGAHRGLGDLPGYRTGGHRARQVQPARQGAGPAGPGPPGRAQGPGRGHPGRGAGGPGPARHRRAARLFRGRAGSRGRRRSRRDRSRPAGRDGWRRQGEPRRIPGRARPAVRGRARPGTAGRRGVRHPRVHPAARATPVRGRPRLQSRGPRPRTRRPARGPAGDGLRVRRGRDRPGRVRQGDRGRGPASWPWTSRGDATTDQVLRWSRGRGADAVLVCAADQSSGPMSRAPALCRDRAAVVMVGDVGMPSRRAPFYEREISLLFARSYGPGRYEPSYEAWGVDYPAGQVRWTEGRNQEAVLDLLAAGRLRVSDLSPSPSASTARTRHSGSWRSGPSPAWRSVSPIRAAAGAGGSGAPQAKPG